MNEEKSQRAIAIILSIAVIALGVYTIFFKKDKKDGIDTKTISIVENVNDFYTVSNCVDKFFTYLSVEDTDSIMILLSNEYKKKNNINSSNLYNFVKKFDREYSFIPKKMYVQQVTANIYKYYVYGQKSYNTFSDEIADQSHIGGDYYIIVILDRSNVTFSIEPYDGEIFNK